MEEELLSLKSWINATFPDPTWLINPLMESGTGAFLHGPSQSYKSFFLLQLAMDVAAGVSPLGVWKASDPVPTLYFQAEGTKRAWRIRLTNAMKDYSENIPFNSIHETTIKVDQPGTRGIVENLIKKTGAKLVIFDPLITWFTGHETDPDAIRGWHSVLNDWKSNLDTAIMLGHHDRQAQFFYSKAAGKMQSHDAGMDEMRGRTELNAWADLTMGFKRKDDVSTLTIQKSRESAIGDKYTFRMQDNRLVLNSAPNLLEVGVKAYIAENNGAVADVIAAMVKEFGGVDRTIRRQIEKLVKEGKLELVGDGSRKVLRLIQE